MCLICLKLRWFRVHNLAVVLQKQILKAVETVCSYLPGDYKSECDAFIETYGDQIIKALNDKIAPDALCKSLGVCSQVITSNLYCNNSVSSHFYSILFR